MKKNSGKKIVLYLLVLLAFAVLLTGLYKLGERCLALRGHGMVSTESYVFTESAADVRNPNRGFYHMHGFRISDEETDFRENVASRFCRDEWTKLTMIEINLQYFRDGEISEQGIRNLEALFEALEAVDKQWILRFLYDWNGENMVSEPETIDVILKHMRQVAPVLEKHKNQIFLIQGLFIGNCGEMNNSKFLGTEDLRVLANQLYEVTPESVYLAVRMPAHWRVITGIAEPEQVVRDSGKLEARLGIYNDGMLGSRTDYGTYGDHTRAEHGDFTFWNREEELAFQDILCSKVPIGGEVIVDNPYNDFENAVKDLSTTHVTYINRDYDAAVQEKWKQSVVEEEGCFYGMDGLTYIERHLGYRLVLRDAALAYDFLQDRLSVDVTIQNVGFAPLYREACVDVILYNEEDNSYSVYPIEQDIRELSGGNQSKECMTLHKEISLNGETEGARAVYLAVTDKLTGETIYLANEQEKETYGYLLGKVVLHPVNTFWEKVAWNRQ